MATFRIKSLKIIHCALNKYVGELCLLWFLTIGHNLYNEAFTLFHRKDFPIDLSQTSIIDQNFFESKIKVHRTEKK